MSTYSNFKIFTRFFAFFGIFSIFILSCSHAKRDDTSSDNSSTCPSNMLEWVDPQTPNWTSPLVANLSDPSVMNFTMSYVTVSCYEFQNCASSQTKMLFFPKDVQCSIYSSNSGNTCSSFAYNALYMATLENLCYLSVACGTPSQSTSPHSLRITAPFQPFAITNNSGNQECTYAGLADSPCYNCPVKP